MRKKGEKITVFDGALATFAQEMFEAMREARGIGLAAQQVGRAVQMCVVDLREADADFDWLLDGAKPPLGVFMPMAVVNPKLTVSRKTPTEVSEEGCLSFPEIRGDVERAVSLTAEYQDQAGLPHVLQCTGLFARCMLHEVDHLNGVLFIDRMEKPVRDALKDELKSLAKETKSGKGPASE